MLRIFTQERMAEISYDIYDDVVDFFCSIGYVIMNNAVDIDVSRHINLNSISNDYTAILDKKYKCCLLSSHARKNSIYIISTSGNYDNFLLIVPSAYINDANIDNSFYDNLVDCDAYKLEPFSTGKKMDAYIIEFYRYKLCTCLCIPLRWNGAYKQSVRMCTDENEDVVTITMYSRGHKDRHTVAHTSYISLSNDYLYGNTVKSNQIMLYSFNDYLSYFVVGTIKEITLKRFNVQTGHSDPPVTYLALPDDGEVSFYYLCILNEMSTSPFRSLVPYFYLRPNLFLPLEVDSLEVSTTADKYNAYCGIPTTSFEDVCYRGTSSAKYATLCPKLSPQDDVQGNGAVVPNYASLYGSVHCSGRTEQLVKNLHYPTSMFNTLDSSIKPFPFFVSVLREPQLLGNFSCVHTTDRLNVVDALYLSDCDIIVNSNKRYISLGNHFYNDTDTMLLFKTDKDVVFSLPVDDGKDYIIDFLYMTNLEGVDIFDIRSSHVLAYSGQNNNIIPKGSVYLNSDLSDYDYICVKYSDTGGQYVYVSKIAVSEITNGVVNLLGTNEFGYVWEIDFSQSTSSYLYCSYINCGIVNIYGYKEEVV